MKILVVSQYFPPEMGAPAGRFHDFAQRWLERGDEVTVVTGVPNFPGGVIHEGYRRELFSSEQIDGVDVKRGFIVTGKRRGMGRPLAYASFLVSASLQVVFRRLAADVVVATIPPPSVGLAGLLAALRLRRPLVVDIRDIWPEAIVQSGRLSNPWVIRTFEAMARLLYRRADLITTVTEGWKARLVEMGVPAEKIEVLPNGVDVEAFDRDAAVDLTPSMDQLDPAARWFTYAGILNTPQGLDIVIDGFARLRDESPEAYAGTQLVLVGEGPKGAELLAQRERLGLERIVFVPRQPRPAVFSLLRRSHGIIVSLRPRKDTSTVPSKIYESMASGRPVLYQAGGEGADTLRTAGGGTVVEPGSPEALAEAMRRYLEEPGLADAHGGAGRAFVEKEYDRRFIARRFGELLEGLKERATPKKPGLEAE